MVQERACPFRHRDAGGVQQNFRQVHIKTLMQGWRKISAKIYLPFMPSLPKRMNEPLLIFHSPHNITDTTNSTGTPWQTRAIHQRVTEEKANKATNP